MDFTLLVKLVQLLLQEEQRLSMRYVQRQFSLDESIMSDLCHELVQSRQTALFDHEAEALVWVGAQPGRPDVDETGSNEADGPGLTRHATQSLTAGDTPTSRSNGYGMSRPERRQLTVMFVDLAGSTEMSTRLDPEDLREVMRSFQDACRNVIRRYGGFIARYMGDGLLVYFGYPRAHEDDPSRAARAGLDIVGTIKAAGKDAVKRHGVCLAVRVGIATGPVVVGDLIGEGAAEEAAVVGETPNLAARLQGIADLDQVVVSDATRKLLKGSFATEHLGEFELKGLHRRVGAWHIAALAPTLDGLQAAPPQHQRPLVGREAELELLRRAWDGARSGHGQVVLVQGEAGVGKSRLLTALRLLINKKQSAHTWQVMQCSAYHTDSALHPAIERVKRVLKWSDDDSNQAKFEKLESVLDAHRSLPPQSPELLAALLSLPVTDGMDALRPMSAHVQREATLDVLTAWLMEEAEGAPMVLVFEDLHWADATTVELFGSLIEQVPTVPMLLVGTYRQEFVPPWPSRSHATPLTLSRLATPEVEAMVGDIAGENVVSEAVVSYIVDKADGVPLFVEELTRTLLASNHVELVDNRYRVTDSLADLHIPETLQDSLMARLDRFPEAREVAQQAAVIGREFSFAMLSELASFSIERLEHALAKLVTDELIYQRGRPPDARYVFKHALIQDAAYQSLLNRSRQATHERVARYFEDKVPDIVEGQPELIARHFAAAGQYERSLQYWERAARRARASSAHAETIGHHRSTLSALSHLPETREMLRCAARAHLGIGRATISALGRTDVDAVHEAFDAAASLSERIDDTVLLSRATQGQFTTLNLSAERDGAERAARRLTRIAERTGRPSDRIVADAAIAENAYWRGQFARSSTHAARAIELVSRCAASGGSLPPYASVAAFLHAGWSAAARGYLETADTHLAAAISLAEDLDVPFPRAMALHYTTIFCLATRRYGEAEVHTAALATMAEQEQWHQFLACSKISNGIRRALTGDYAEGLVEFQEGYALWRAIGAAIGSTKFQVLFGEAHLLAGNVDACRQCLAEARRLIRSHGDDVYMTEVYRLEGECHLADATQDSFQQAHRCFDNSIRRAREQGAKTFELRTIVSLARALRTDGRADEAVAILGPMHRSFTEGLDFIDLVTARELLHDLTHRAE